MRTAETTPPIPEVDPRDPFYYGYRYELQAGQFVMVPLTREDVLHPGEECKNWKQNCDGCAAKNKS